MGSNPIPGRAKELATKITLGCAILAVLVPLGFGINDLVNKPDLTYERSRHSIPAQKSMISIVVRNEGWATAKQVEVMAKVNGEIENVVVLPGDIAGEIPWFELPGESVNIYPIYPSSEKIIKIDFIAKRMKYTIDLIIKSQNDKLIQALIVQCVNDGQAKEYGEKSGLALEWLSKGFGAGVTLTIASVFLYKSFRQHPKKGQETPEKI